MPILIECSSCHRKLRVNDQLLGKTVKCPNCQTKFAAEKIAETLIAGGDAGSGVVLDLPLSAQRLLDSTKALLELPPVEPQSPASLPTTGKISDPGLASDAAKQELSAPPPPPVPEPFERPAFQVFAVVFGIVLAAGIVGLTVGWFAGRAVERTAAARAVDEP